MSGASQQQPEADPRATFAAHLTHLGYQGHIFLGVVENPQSGEKQPPNLDAARVIIATFEMLEEKTRGNLDEQEDAFLQRLLSDLRMRYVEKSKEARSG